MNKILLVAQREFLATAATKAFIVGILVTPVIIGIMVVVMPILMKDRAPAIEGELALIDRSGKVAPGVQAHLAPAAIAARRGDLTKTALEMAPAGVGSMSTAAGGEIDEAMDDFLGKVPQIEVKVLEGQTDPEPEKAALKEGTVQDGGRLAVAVVHEDAVEKAPGADRFGRYDLFVREKLDDRIQSELRDALRESIVSARLEAAGIEPDSVTELTTVGRVRSITVTEHGEKETNEVLNILVPGGFMMLLILSVMMSGQTLLTSTIEEKSSRVVEILLSSVSPLELMTGKILGQMGVGFVVLSVYAGMGLLALGSFAALGLIQLHLLFFLVLFFVLSYFQIAALMGAIGAAVNEIKEAQSLLTPVMVFIMVPWILWMPITRDPSSTLATALSFVPPINSFVVLLRMTSTEPPPAWQVAASIGVGVVGVYAALWLAAKIFRIGLLMHGKPPNLRTLVRWVREA